MQSTLSTYFMSYPTYQPRFQVVFLPNLYFHHQNYVPRFFPSPMKNIRYFPFDTKIQFSKMLPKQIKTTQTSLNFEAISLHVSHFSFAQNEVDNTNRKTNIKYIISFCKQNEFTIVPCKFVPEACVRAKVSGILRHKCKTIL